VFRLWFCTLLFFHTYKPFTSHDTLNLVYYSYFHSLMTYGIIFWGNYSHSFLALGFCDRALWANCEERENTNKMQQSDVYYQHCLNMFRASLCPSSGEQRPCVTACGVLRWFCWMWLVAVVGRCIVGCEHCEGYCSTFQTQYVSSLVLFVINNEDQCTLNSEIHSINTRQNSNLYQPPSNLTMYQKETYYFGIKIFNNLPSDIKKIMSPFKQFRLTLSDFLNLNPFYNLDYYFNTTKV